MIHFSLITPEREVFSGDALSVTLPTASGEIQILQGHAPLVSLLRAGEVRVAHDGKETTLAVSGGYIEVRPDSNVIVLAETAERAEEIDMGRAEAARERAAALLSEKVRDEVEYANVIGLVEKEMARVRVARKHRSHHSPIGDGGVS